jgi:hypothetical protein
MAAAGGTVDFSSRPRMLRCYLCGREYGSLSIAIHQPQCQRRWALVELTKPLGQRRAMPEPPKAGSVELFEFRV